MTSAAWFRPSCGSAVRGGPRAGVLSGPQDLKAGASGWPSQYTSSGWGPARMARTASYGLV